MTRQSVNVTGKVEEAVIASQKEMIIEYLLLGFSLTQREAYKHFGCSKLSTRISESIRDGWPI
jgi:hypothetical protein